MPPELSAQYAGVAEVPHDANESELALRETLLIVPAAALSESRSQGRTLTNVLAIKDCFSLAQRHSLMGGVLPPELAYPRNPLILFALPVCCRGIGQSRASPPFRLPAWWRGFRR